MSAHLRPDPLDVESPRRRFSVADLVRMVEVGLLSEDERLEVTDGEIVETSPKGYRHEGLKGAINRHWLAIEVAESSLAYDLRRKPGIYAGHGVRELWVVDVAARRIHRHREPTGRGDARVDVVEAGDRIEPGDGPAAMGFVLDEMTER